MKVLIGCEESGTVRDAFTALGHDATSCDLMQSRTPGKHYQGSIFDIINDGWDMAVFFPPCTYLCSSGLHWNKRVLGRAEKTAQAIDFAKKLWAANIPLIALENSIGCLSTHLGKPSQIIQPYNFGEDASKATCLWLKGLPLLQNTGYFSPRIVNGKKRWGNQTDSGQNKLVPSETRAIERSKTYPGIAQAMATQWSKPYINQHFFNMNQSLLSFVNAKKFFPAYAKVPDWLHKVGGRNGNRLVCFTDNDKKLIAKGLRKLAKEIEQM